MVLQFLYLYLVIRQNIINLEQLHALRFRYKITDVPGNGQEKSFPTTLKMTLLI